MALITGLPNFAAAVGPTSTNFNAAAKAFGQQIGGQYFDSVAGSYVQSSGNLDNTNIVAAPGFRNSQKKEAKSYFSSVTWNQVTNNPTSPWNGVSIVGPFGFPCVLTGISVMSLVKSDVFLNPATSSTVSYLTVTVNGYSTVYSVNLGSAPGTQATTATDAVYLPVDIPLGAQDFLQIDPSGINATAAQGDVLFQFFWVANHVRS